MKSCVEIPPKVMACPGKQYSILVERVMQMDESTRLNVRFGGVDQFATWLFIEQIIW